MENTISFNTKFGWITAKEINDKITKIQFKKENLEVFSSKVLKKLKKNFIYILKGKITN